ncbi:GatB/YqeY domain-containing protein [Patescibacteria group bacterium]|nr:GatB/YqeY domain-containing protein [Patescibacteria group bacterium]MBU4162333.1 GatB/YqeY domain-containing protein [Patescibacteria group bacterium]
MDLREKVQKDLQESLKNNQERKLSVLRLLLDGIIKKEKEKRVIIKDAKDEAEIIEKSRLTDQEILQIISFFIKKSKEAVGQFETGKRQDLADKEKEEIEILNQYLPEQMPEEEIRKLVEEAIKETKAESIKDMGKIMSILMLKIQGKADGGIVSAIVKELLAK